LEVNPRASRTVPFVSKAIGVPLAKLAAKIMAGKKLKELGFTKEINPPFMSVKEVVLPFVRFRGIDILLGPEMKSTGEVMGIADNFDEAFAKAQIAASSGLPVKGTIFLSVKERDKDKVAILAKELSALGFDLVGTEGTANIVKKLGVPITALKKISEGSPNVTDYITGNKLALVINTPSGEKPRKDEVVIRSLAVSRGVPCITTIEGAIASVRAMRAMKTATLSVSSLQNYHEKIKSAPCLQAVPLEK
jgi:carbamoyl-phosphate synthase large subunit